MALYQALVDLALPGSLYAMAGDTLDDTGAGRGTWPVPSSWIPPAQSVNALDADAGQKLWNAGPRVCPSQPWLGSGVVGVPRWVGRNPVKPVNWWYQVSGPPNIEGYSPNTPAFLLKGFENLGIQFMPWT